MPENAYPLTPSSLDELRDLIGKELGPTDWHEVTQERVDAFADATGDHQWIHVDPERAAAGPLGSTIAHGLYTLSLESAFLYALLSFEGFAHGL
ncbi:MaoC family dehydratase, partial [Nocardia aurea]|uniref:MaoC family dehydratase n=1 Tax=Nocardia aurea TaxID=2144174 RepID=UPI0018E517F8